MSPKLLVQEKLAIEETIVPRPQLRRKGKTAAKRDQEKTFSIERKREHDMRVLGTTYYV